MRLAQILARLFDRKVGDQDSVESGMPRHFAELGQSHSQDRIQIRENDEPHGLRMLANLSRQLQYLIERRTVLQSALTGSLDDRPIGPWIAEGHAQLDDVRP